MKKLKAIFGFSLTFLMVGCGSTSSLSTPVSSSSSSSSPVSSSSSTNLPTKTNEDFEYAKTSYVKDGKEYDLNMNTLYTNQGAPHLDPLVEQHVMVVPFGFKDSSLQAVQNDATIERIRTTFFGTKEEIASVGGWMSVSDYFKGSSYGKSDFEGQVIPTWCVYDGTADDFYAANSSNLGISAAEYARNWYLSEYNKENHGSLGADAKDLTYFDANKDGKIDLIWIVYSQPTDHVNQRWWAYVTYKTNAANLDAPTVNTLGWASIDWMSQAFNGYDPHTYIHETGHTYGLDDYYDYSNTWSPMGGIDMMDHNLGDHSAFSKFSLGWTAPLVVDDSATITLRPMTTTGDCFILPSPGYNGTAFDEYMMVELMAPVGIAEVDYKNGYSNVNGYSKPGIRISHIDARVFKDAKAYSDHNTYLKDNPEEGQDFRVSNTPIGRRDDHADSDYWLSGNNKKRYMSLTSIFESVFDETNNTTTSKNYVASNTSLFTAKQSFTLSSSTAKWASTYMPSQSNLWNKAKTITGGNVTNQKFTIDETCTFDYRLYISSIQEDAEYGWVAKVQVNKLV